MSACGGKQMVDATRLAEVFLLLDAKENSMFLRRFVAIVAMFFFWFGLVPGDRHGPGLNSFGRYCMSDENKIPEGPERAPDDDSEESQSVGEQRITKWAVRPELDCDEILVVDDLLMINLTGLLGIATIQIEDGRWFHVSPEWRIEEITNPKDVKSLQELPEDTGDIQ
jgi:hypothetical protein